MDTKPLLFGLIGFFIGGFIVSFAAVTFDKPERESMSSSMQYATSQLEKMSADAFDEAFMREMIAHHEGAIAMAELAESRAKHQEIRQLSRGIISTQAAEIEQMKQWSELWGYEVSPHESGDTMRH